MKNLIKSIAVVSLLTGTIFAFNAQAFHHHSCSTNPLEVCSSETVYFEDGSSIEVIIPGHVNPQQ